MSRNTTGRYGFSTAKQMVCCIYCWNQEGQWWSIPTINPAVIAFWSLPTHAPNIFDKCNPTFRDLHHTMDSLCRRLRAEGVGAEKHSAKPFTKEDENKLWELGIMGTYSPTPLLRAVFFYNRKNFCLRGGKEHRNLKLSQLKRTQKGCIYTENASRNWQGQLRQKNKSVEILENHQVGDCCHCVLLDLYISKLPTVWSILRAHIKIMPWSAPSSSMNYII